MSLETATFIDDLDANNPTTTDSKSQGDDHFRLLKSVLKNSVKRVSRAFYVPGTVHKAGNYSVVASDDNRTITCDTTAAFTLTLPTLAAADAGWCIYVIKTSSDANPVWIAPPSGTINGFSKIRRSVSYVITKVFWNGGGFFASRPQGLPVGSVIDFHGSGLPNGHLWADGRTFTAADFVELNSVLGGNTKPDYRGRVGAGNDNPGALGAAGRIGTVVTDGGTITGGITGSTGGSSTHIQTLAELAAHPHGTTETPHGHPGSTTTGETHSSGAQGGAGANQSSSPGTVTIAPALTNLTVNSAGGSGAMALLQPTIISFKILVAE